MAGVDFSGKSGRLATLHECSEGLVNGLVGRECSTHIGSEEGEVRTRSIAFQVFAAISAVEVRRMVFCTEIIIIH